MLAIVFGLRRQTSAAPAAGPLQFVIEPVEIRRRELLQHYATQPRDDVPLQITVVGIPRLDADLAAMVAAGGGSRRPA
jgi:hypothetical protein